MERRGAEVEREWNAALERVVPQEILRWARETFGDGLTMACSFGGVSGMVLLDMAVKELGADLSVFTLDTGFLFPETHATRDEATRRYGIRPLVMVPVPSATPGPRLPSVEACCAARKVEPNRRALAGKSAWIAGLRRDQSKTRARVSPISWDAEFALYKIAPLWAWTEDDCWDYVKAHDVPVNPLHSQGYASIGCTTCTRAVAPGEDLRAGRWADEEKIECGLHLKITPGPDNGEKSPLSGGRG